MSPAYAEDAAVIRPSDHFLGARDFPHPEDRLIEVRHRARAFREELLSGSPVVFYRSFSLVRVPYPTRFGLGGATTASAPYLHILNRMFVIQFRSPAGIKTLLASPSDAEANARTPFFARLSASFGPFQGLGARIMAPQLGTVEGCLAELGLEPADVDYLSYDHLHTQDLRRWLGVGDEPGLFPNARLLVMRQEWESAQSLLPPQRDWYCPGGIEGVDPGRVILLDDTSILGEGVALMATPGHTEGNHSFVVHVPGGRLLVTSENGIAADCYAPLESRIPGVRAFAKATGVEVVLNANTLERGLDQYISMVQEREVAGPHPEAAGFYDVFPSSELAPWWLAPGLRPTLAFGEISLGTLHRQGQPVAGAKAA